MGAEGKIFATMLLHFVIKAMQHDHVLKKKLNLNPTPEAGKILAVILLTNDSIVLQAMLIWLTGR